MIKRLVVIASICVIATVVVVGVSMNVATRALYACKTMNISSLCVVEHVDETIQQRPHKGADLLEQLAKLKRHKLVGGDFRSFSNSLHHLGFVFYHKGISPDMVTRVCPALIKDGCVHGYVMAFIDDHDVSLGSTLCTENSADRRLYYGCWHALGHSYAQKSSAQQTLSDVLADNPCMPTGLEQDACIAGIFHEDARHGLHQDHGTYYDRSVGTDFDVSCADVPGDFRRMCLLSRASFSQYNPNSDLQLGEEICTHTDHQKDYDFCSRMLYERELIGKGYAFLPK